MTLYNLSVLTNSTTIGDLFIAADTYSGGATGAPVLFAYILIAIFFVILIGLKRYEFLDGLLTSSTITFMLSVILLFTQMLSIMWPIIFGSLMMLSTLAYYWLNKGG